MGRRAVFVDSYMKKKLSIIGILLLPLFFLSACSTNLQKQDIAPASSSPNFSQPEESPDINGVVKSITGNEAVVLVLPDSFNQAGQRQNLTATETPEAQLNPSAALGGGPMMGGGPGAGRPEGGSDNGETRAAMLSAIKEQSTGEERIVIPVGIQMLKPSTEAKSREMVSASLSDITQDKMIRVWLDDSVTNRQVAKFVVIMQ